MSREIQRYLKGNIPAYPDEALRLLNHIAHTVDRTRNGFSESHFGNEAEKWLSTFVRDCVNSAIRLLLSFM
jgi:septation ring formation regulator EzrA